MKQQEVILPPEHQEIADTSDTLGRLYMNLGRHTEALPLLRRALSISETIWGSDHLDVARSMCHLANLLYSSQGSETYSDDVHIQYRQPLSSLDEAHVLYRRALQILEVVQGADHPETAGCLVGLAHVLVFRGSPERAEVLYRKAIAIEKKVLGIEHPHTAISLSSLATLLYDKGDRESVAEAEYLYQEALDILERTRYPNHPDYAYCLRGLASLLCNRSEGDNSLKTPR